MDWLNKLFKPGAPGNASEASILWLYVQCDRCKSPVAVRVNLSNDLSLNDAGNGYILHKEIMDDKCFRLMSAELEFDAQRHIREQRIEGGKFLTRHDYERLKGGGT